MFTQSHPWGGEPVQEWQDQHQYPRHLRGDDGFTSIPIRELCHVTHDKEADMICSTLSDGYYSFKPTQKLGKQYGDDRLPLGETYSFDQEQENFYEIPRSPHLPVFPGYLSWWGVSVTRWYEEDNDHVNTFTSNIDQLESQGIHTAKYLKTTPDSTYGNNSFRISFSSLLHSYKEARVGADQSITANPITLRVGGTLRYKYEICYVVIVSTEQDSAQLVQYPSVYGKHIFESNGVISQEGNIVDDSKFPEFKAQYIISSIKDSYNWWHNFSWEGIAFAFYFPSEESELRCKVQDVTRDTIQHSFCTSRRKVPQGRLCPNEVQ